MSRKSDIEELLAEVEEISSNFSLEYEKAKTDLSINQISRAKVKSALEHLRSILDYSAIDVYEYVYQKTRKNLYFPRAETEAKFSKRLEEGGFIGLEQKNNKIYKLLLAFQPFFCGSNWLIDLCKFTNKNKHNNLTEQVKKTTDSLSIGFIGKFSNVDKIIITGGSVNGIPITKDPSVPIIITNSMSTEEVVDSFNPDNPYLPVVRSTDEVYFYIDGSDIDALSLIREAKNNILVFIGDLYNEIGV